MSEQQLPNYADWVAKKRYVPRNMICAFIKGAEGMDEKLTAALKEIFELRCSNMEGFQSGHDVGLTQDGVVAMAPFTPRPVMYISEVEGKPINAALTKWAQDHVIGKKPADIKDGVELLFIEPDATHRHVVDAWLMTGVWPGNTGKTEVNRDLAGIRDPQMYEIQLAGNVQYGTPEVRALAQQKLDEYQQLNRNPYSLIDPYQEYVKATLAITDDVYSSVDFAVEALTKHLTEVGHHSKRMPAHEVNRVRMTTAIEVLGVTTGGPNAPYLYEYIDEHKRTAFEFIDNTAQMDGVTERSVWYESHVYIPKGENFEAGLNLHVKTTLAYNYGVTLTDAQA